MTHASLVFHPIGDLPNPNAALAMFQVHDLLVRPIEMDGNQGYLLADCFQGVAYDSPNVLVSTSNACLHCGHSVFTWPFELPLISL